jgi:farnesyl diphosphate synthase
LLDADDRHHLIVVYKTAFYSFYLPVALAMKMVCRSLLAKRSAADLSSVLKTKRNTMPHSRSLFPLENTSRFRMITWMLSPTQRFWVKLVLISSYVYFLLVIPFWVPECRSGTDEQDNKCSWNINIALANATPEQRKILDDNYGRKSPESEAKVKEVFAQAPISIPERFEKYEGETYTELSSLIEGIDESRGLKKEVFTSFLEKVYKRSK